MLAQLEALHPEDVRIILRHFPLLTIHDKASLAAEAAEAAGAQGSFWQMHDHLFERHADWVDLTPEEFMIWLKDAAVELNLDLAKFSQDLETRRYQETMRTAFEQTAAAGIPGTPFVYLNGDWYRLPLSLINLEASTRLLLLANRQYQTYPGFNLDLQSRYLARLQLSNGEMLIELLPASAPLAVNNFVFLATEGWFDGIPFHRVVRDVIVESGDPSGTGLGDPGYHFENEIDPSLSFDEPGMVGLVSYGSSTNGSQFFINLQPLPDWNGTRTIFGKVVEGLELLEQLDERDPLEDLLSPAEMQILSVTIEVQ
ncbi:MAG: thioredoxin domain-containing protein [Anaerolineales bacterium]|nr:thioredoxin domain-containing protein [Anaerolineales bacterium]